MSSTLTTALHLFYHVRVCRLRHRDNVLALDLYIQVHGLGVPMQRYHVDPFIGASGAERKMLVSERRLWGGVDHSLRVPLLHGF